MPQDRFRLLSGEDALQEYQFNTGIARHLFCRHCGIYGSHHPRSAPDAYQVNVRCLDDFDGDLNGLEIIRFDGRNWEVSFAALNG